MNTTAYYVKKTSKFIKLCKGDMSRRLKTAKLNQGRKRRVLNSRAALPYKTSHSESAYLKTIVLIDVCYADREWLN